MDLNKDKNNSPLFSERLHRKLVKTCFNYKIATDLANVVKNKNEFLNKENMKLACEFATNLIKLKNLGGTDSI